MARHLQERLDATSRFERTPSNGKCEVLSAIGVRNGELPNRVNNDSNRLIHAKDERAGIFESPLHIGHRELRLNFQLVSGSMLHSKCQRHRVILAAEPERAGHLYLRTSLWRDRSLHVFWRENNIREFRAFNNFLMHFLVAPIASTFAAGRVYHHGPTGLATRGVEMNLAAFKLERAVHGMRRGRQREFDFRLRGIERENRLLRERCGNNG